MVADNYAARDQMLNLIKSLPQNEIDALADSIFTESLSAGDDFFSKLMGVDVLYGVYLFGSGLVGDMLGKESYSHARKILLPFGESGKLRCFKWWCQECQNNGFNVIKVPEFHFAISSFATVKKIVANQKVTWRWRDPNSDYAKTHGGPADAFQALIDAKSKPNWKVTIGYTVK